MVVAKILRSLTTKFNHVASSNIEAKDLKTLSVEELCGSLLAHEVRLNMTEEKMEEKVFHVVSKDGASGSESRLSCKGSGQPIFRGQGRG